MGFTDGKRTSEINKEENMKKTLALLLALTMVFALFASQTAFADDADDIHIGIITGSVSQSEDDRRGAEAFQAMYGEDMVKLAIYPDNFTEELETTIQTIVNMSDDPKMKAVIVNQAVPGTTEAFRQIKERRPDIICIAGESHEDLPEIGSAADLVCNNDFSSSLRPLPTPPPMSVLPALRPTSLRRLPNGSRSTARIPLSSAPMTPTPSLCSSSCSSTADASSRLTCPLPPWATPAPWAST